MKLMKQGNGILNYYITKGDKIGTIRSWSTFATIEEVLYEYSHYEIFFTHDTCKFFGNECINHHELLGEFETRDDIKNEFVEFLI